MKLQQMNKKQYFVSLPNQIVRAKGWQKGDEIKIEIDSNGNLILKK
jgi:antitoxin component of MazEF toxin-antitoxin module